MGCWDGYSDDSGDAVGYDFYRGLSNFHRSVYFHRRLFHDIQFADSDILDSQRCLLLVLSWAWSVEGGR
jgi:hypothetical protein